KEIERRFGMTGALQDASLASDEGEDVAWAEEVRGLRGGLAKDLDRPGPIVGGDPGRGAGSGVHADRERGPHALVVRGDHRREIELMRSSRGDRSADDTRRMTKEESDLVWGRVVRAHHEIAFIFSILVVDDDYDLAPRKGSRGVLDLDEVHGKTLSFFT